MEDIEAPADATGTDKRRFAVTLMNRLIFIKNLENKGVVSSGLLLDRLEAYEENEDAFMRSFYEAQLKPLFYDLFNRPRDERPPRLKTGWAGDIPYLNGGLFRENVDNEKDYTVRDRVLPEIIRELIEGGGLNMRGDSLDPAILGSVFEKTINFIGGEFGTQKDVGAYYTPDDVTQVITEQTVNPKLHDLLIDAWVENTNTSNERGQYEVRQYLENELSLSDFLEKVENGQETALRHGDSFIEIDFGDERIIGAAIDQLNTLSIVDPACGSGHFLTTVMEQTHRVRTALERGRNGGDSPPPEENYEAKKQLALNAIYGVDVDPVAVEIARLRVWLKIIEDGWEEEYGRLPNIELNIISGNSLVGLPVEQTGATRLTQYGDRLSELVKLRQQYKQEDSISKQEVLDQRDEIREELDEEFANRLSYTTETSITSTEELNRILNCIPTGPLYPEIESVKVQRSDGNALSDSDKKRLENLGFRTYKKSARLDIEARHDDLRQSGAANSNADARSQIEESLRTLLQSGYSFVEVKRQPVKADVDDTLGTPIHWMAEFPEVTSEDSNQSVGFDIVIGNPPYGNILSDSEKVCTAWYEANDPNEIAVTFAVRQLQLLSDSGYFGNITSLRLIVQSSLVDVHNMFRNRMEYTNLAAFGYRPSYIFDNAEIQVSIITGKQGDSSWGDFRTSEFIWLENDRREKQLQDITYESVDGYVITDSIGSWGDDGFHIMPKIGNRNIRSILDSLKDQSDHLLGERYSRKDETRHIVWRRRGLLYWTNPMLEELYDAQEVQPMYFDNELEQKAAFMLLNSNLFYLYWVVYGNQRHLNWGEINAFPFPSEDDLEQHREAIIESAEKLWKGMKQSFNENTYHFHTGEMKPVIDEFEETVVADLYGLDDNQVQFLQQFHTQKGRGAN